MSFIADLAIWQKVLALFIGFLTLLSSAVALGFNLRPALDDAVNVPLALEALTIQVDEGFSAVQDSLAIVRMSITEQSSVIRQQGQRLRITEEAMCSDSEIEHNGVERRIDCGAVERLNNLGN